jgi:CBS domain-containing protein
LLRFAAGVSATYNPVAINQFGGRYRVETKAADPIAPIASITTHLSTVSMGEQKVQDRSDGEELRIFSRKLLSDLRALEKMLEQGLFETEIRRIGAEQEMFLVDQDWRPSLQALEVLERLDDPHFTTELGRFNLECNLDPVRLGGAALSELESQLNILLHKARLAAADLGVDILLCGILPTLDKSDLSLDNMTPRPRYFALNEAMNRLRGERYQLYIKGRDEINVTHDNVMLESCNTSFQVHFQVQPEDFARLYNIAQAVAAPVLAAATNSPILFGRQLWRETRIALFQQSIDTRSPAGHPRSQSPRVSFGRAWVDESVIEIYKEDISRFRVLMSTDVEEDPFEALERGEAPELRALRLHNGTIYRWNRPCYGISSGKAHLRIENRVLPSGPTPLDEIANAALWFGLLSGVSRLYGDVTRVMEFEVARENFVAAARLGLGAQLTWPKRGSIPAQQLLLVELLPLATEGLQALDIDGSDIDRYLGVIEERVRSLRTGSQWLVESYDGMKCDGRRAECLSALVAATAGRQRTGQPVHTWDLAELKEAGGGKQHYLRIDQLMNTDLFTVNQDDLVDIVACVMNWHHIRHVPVEDNLHRLVGLVTHRALLRLLAENATGQGGGPVPVSKIMTTDVVTVEPETPTIEAMRLMREKRISCLPVVDPHNRLVGIVTERDFMTIAGDLFEAYLD